jgi:hypothetical protein
MRRLYTLPFLLAAIAILAAVPSATVAQVASWSQPFEISDTARFSWFPDLAVGADDTVHIVWASGDPDPESPRDGTKAIDLLRYRELRAGAWSATNDILYTGRGGYTVRNSVAVGRDGRLYVLVRMGVQIYITSAPQEASWSARSWTPPLRLSNIIGYYTALAVDGANTLHAFWSEAAQPNDDDTCPNCSDLFYRRSSDGGATWSEPQNLSHTPSGENRPQVVVDERNRIHAVWDQGVDWYAGAGKPEVGVYRRSDDGGLTWSNPVNFTAGGRPVQQTSLAVDTQGNPLVVFRDAESDRVYFQSSPDGGDSWSPVGEIPGVRARDLNDNNLDTYALAVDGAGRAHLLLNGFPIDRATVNPNPWLLHLTWDGNRWSAPDAVMSNELFPEWPQLVISEGNQLHAVWFTRRSIDRFSSEDGAWYQVWYSTLVVDAPTRPPPPTFTPLPSSPPTVIQTTLTAEPTATSLPAVARQVPPPDGPPAWELQGMQVIGLALLPLAGLMALVTLVLAFRRR